MTARAEPRPRKSPPSLPPPHPGFCAAMSRDLLEALGALEVEGAPFWRGIRQCRSVGFSGLKTNGGVRWSTGADRPIKTSRRSDSSGESIAEHFAIRVPSMFLSKKHKLMAPSQPDSDWENQ